MISEGVELENQAKIIQQYQALTPRIWNELNRLQWMKIKSRRDKKGFKKVECFEYFGLEDIDYNDIDTIVNEYHKLKLIHRDKAGWYKMTKKGRKHLKNLQEANN